MKINSRTVNDSFRFKDQNPNEFLKTSSTELPITKFSTVNSFNLAVSLFNLAIIFMTNKALITPILFFLSISLFGQKYTYTQYYQEYLSPFTSAKTVFQDSLGYIWVGSQEGLFRFNGKNFENHSTILKSRHIHSIEDHFFVSDGGLFQLQLQPSPKAQIVLPATLAASDTSLYFPNNLLRDTEGKFWISQSNHTIVYYDGTSLRKYPLPKQPKNTHIYFHQDQWSNIWALSDVDGLYSLDQENNEFSKRKNIKNAKAIYGKDNLLWIGGNELRVFRINENKRLQPLRTWRLKDTKIQSITQNKQGQYLIGTKHKGLFLLNDETAQLEQVFGSNDPHRIDELEFATIGEVFVTPDSIGESGAVWVASSSGLWLLKEKYFQDVPNLPRSAARSITFGKKDEAWISFGDLYQVEAKNKQLTASPFDFDTQITTSLYHKNRLWLSTSDYEILVFQNKQLLRKYDLSQRGEGIFHLYADGQDNVWFCQAPSEQPILGLAKINANQQVELYGEDKGFESRILAVKESKRGTLYAAGIGTNTYLYQFDNEQDSFLNISLPIPFRVSQNFEVHDLTIDDRGVIWLATTDGLLIYDGEKVRRAKIPILAKEVRSVCVGESNSIWAATATEGIVYFNISGDHYVNFKESSGLPSLINSYRCLRRDEQNRIWVCTAEGVVHSTGKMTTPPISTMPEFINIVTNGNSTKPTKRLKITDNKQLQITYQSLAYPGDKILYQYRVLPKEEVDFATENQLWNTPSNENTFTLNNLPIDEYLVQIRAKESGGYQWSSINSLALNIRQVWYKKWWIIAATIGLILFLFGSYIRLFLLKRLQYLEKLLSKQQQELAKQESVIQTQSKTLDHQQEELKEAMSNIATLHLIISQVEPNSSWEELIIAVGRAIDQSIGIDAFEIAYQKGEKVIYNGYSSKEEGGITYRSKALDSKTSLTSYALAFQRELLINDFETEHTKYIEKKEAYLFHSMSFTPFILSNGTAAVLCAYHTATNQFGEHDVLMLKVLADYLCLSAIDEFE